MNTLGRNPGPDGSALCDDGGLPKAPVTGASRRPYLSKYVIFQLRQAIKVIEESTMPPLKPNLPASPGAAWLRRLCDWHDERKRS